MGKQKAPSFPFYYRDWLHAVRRWTAEEKIEYLEMLCEQADQTSGSVPEDIFSTECHTDKVREKFEKDSNGWFNLRLRDVLTKRNAFKQSRIDNLNSKPEPKADPHKGPHMDPHMEKEKEKEKGNKKPKKKSTTPAKVDNDPPPLVYPFTDELFFNRWHVWKEYKDEQFKFKFKHKGEQAALIEIGKLSNGNMEVALAIIHQSMSHGWKGLFQLKGGNQPTTPDEVADYTQRVKNSMK